MRPPAAPWWRQSAVLGVGAGAFVALAAVVAILVATGGESSDRDEDSASSEVFRDRVNTSLFPGVSQSEFESAVDDTCSRFKYYLDGRQVSTDVIANYIRSASKAAITRRGWVQHSSNRDFDLAILANQEVAIEAAAFQGDDGPCAEYEAEWEEAGPLLSLK